MTLFDTLDDARLPPATERRRVVADVPENGWRHWTFAAAIAFLFAIQASGQVMWQTARAVVPWDSKNHFYPMFRFLGEALRQGTLPLWNPYHFSGYPAVADPQSLIFTPSMMLFALIKPDAGMTVFDRVIAAHLLAGGIGVLGLARRWRWHPAAGLLAAAVFMLGGSASSRLQHTGMIISYSWFPLALWSLQAALDRRSIGLAVLAGLVATLMALGRDQVAYLLCITLLGAVIHEILTAPSARAYLRSRLPVLACAGMVAIACMLAPILLTMQFLHGSNRPGIAYGMALEGSLDPVNLLTAFSPDIFGSLDRIYDYWGPGAATIAGNDWTDRAIDYLFIGTLPVVLIVWHGLAGRRLLEHGLRSFAVLLVAATVYALGRHSPFFGVMFDWMPGVALYRRPADASFLINIAAAYGSGALLHRFVRDGLPTMAARRVTDWIAPVLTLGALALLVGSGLSFALRAGHFEASLRHLLSSGALAVAIALTLIASRARHRGGVALLLVALTASQLVWCNSASPLNAEPASTYSAYDGLYPDQAKGLAVLQQALANREAAGDHPRVEILGLDGSWQNAAMTFKLQDTVGYNPLRIAAYEKAVGVAESASDLGLRTFPDTFRGYNSRLAAMLGLDYLVIDRPIADLPRPVPRPRATLLFAGDHFYVYRLDTAAAPRAYIATRVTPVDSNGAIEDGWMPSFVMGKEALVEAGDIRQLHDKALLTASADTTSTPASAVITAYGDNDVTLSVETVTAGLLVLHDLAYPGWVATIDGHDAPILRANLLFRGVEVGPGRHTVHFAFHPLSIANLAGAAAGLLRKGR